MSSTLLSASIIQTIGVHAQQIAIMRLIHLALLAFTAERAYGYLDSSPFFLFSTSELLIPTAQLQSASSLTSDIAHTLSSCPSDIYILVKQPGVSASDYVAAVNAPALARYMTAGPETSIRSSASIADVVGEIDISRLQDVLEKQCGVRTFDLDKNIRSVPRQEGGKPTLLRISYTPPSLEHLAQTLNENDIFLASVLARLPSQNYTVLYTTLPPAETNSRPASEAYKYEMETPLEEVMHLDLRRDVEFRPRQSSSNQTLVDGPLFERYQFLSPGIFMGFLVGFILLSILYVAISGVAGMQVTYAAFDKELAQSTKKRSE